MREQKGAGAAMGATRESGQRQQATRAIVLEYTQSLIVWFQRWTSMRSLGMKLGSKVRDEGKIDGVWSCGIRDGF